MLRMGTTTRSASTPAPSGNGKAGRTRHVPRTSMESDGLIPVSPTVARWPPASPSRRRDSAIRTPRPSVGQRAHPAVYRKLAENLHRDLASALRSMIALRFTRSNHLHPAALLQMVDLGKGDWGALRQRPSAGTRRHLHFDGAVDLRRGLSPASTLLGIASFNPPADDGRWAAVLPSASRSWLPRTWRDHRLTPHARSAAAGRP